MPPTFSALPVAAVQQLRILLVEDNDDIRSVARETLESQGHRNTEASNGHDALTCLREGSYDVLITDIVMPGGLSGLELAQAAGRHSPDIRILLVTGYASRYEELAGSYPVLRKPFAAEELQRALETLQRARAAAEAV